MTGEPGKLVQHPSLAANSRTYRNVTYPEPLGGYGADANARRQLQRIMKEQRLFERIREHGLAAPQAAASRPTRYRKTAASVLAGKLGILFPGAVGRAHHKVLGRTPRQAATGFDAIADVRGVYFFDEFDSIGSPARFGQ